MADAFTISIREYKAAFKAADKVDTAIARAHVKTLKKSGAKIRQRMKSIIRYRKKASAADGKSPPSAHRADHFTRETTNRKTGAVTRRPTSPLKELIYFAVDPQRLSVVIGPARFREGTGGGGVTTKILEKGGRTNIKIPNKRPRVGRKAGMWQAAVFRRLIKEGRIKRPPSAGFTLKPIVIAPRPYASTAGDLESRRGKFNESLKSFMR